MEAVNSEEVIEYEDGKFATYDEVDRMLIVWSLFNGLRWDIIEREKKNRGQK